MCKQKLLKINELWQLREYGVRFSTREPFGEMGTNRTPATVQTGTKIGRKSGPKNGGNWRKWLDFGGNGEIFC